MCWHKAVYIVNHFYGVTDDIRVVQGKGKKQVFIVGDKYYLSAAPSNEGYLFNPGPCPENLQKKKKKLPPLQLKQPSDSDFISRNLTKEVKFLECFNCNGNHDIENCATNSCLRCRVSKLPHNHTPSQCIYIPKCVMCLGLHHISQCRKMPCPYCKIMGLDSNHPGNVCKSYKVYYFS